MAIAASGHISTSERSEVGVGLFDRLTIESEKPYFTEALATPL